MYRLRENRDMAPRTFMSLVGTTLYEHRLGPFFVAPIVVGLDNGVPLICNYDSIGSQTDSKDFSVAGTGGDMFYSLCEAYFRPDLGPQELSDVLANTFVSGIDRDIMSGWGGIIYVMTPEKLDIKYIKTKLT